MSRRRPLIVEFTQAIIRWICRLGMMLCFRIRMHGLTNYPPEDGFLICSNHQSTLDPVVLGVACPRPINYLARESLFEFRPFARFLKWNDTIPIDREGSALGGVKETMKRLKRGESVMLFPEGTRTLDGELQPLKLGFCTLARRTKSPLVPIAIAGAFEALPKTGWFPLPRPIHVVIGEPICYEHYEDLTDQQMADRLFQRMKTCLDEARKHRYR